MANECILNLTGDVQKDFWLAFDLLRNPKDHAEFSIVRDWVRDTLKVSDPNAQSDTFN